MENNFSFLSFFDKTNRFLDIHANVNGKRLKDGGELDNNFLTFINFSNNTKGMKKLVIQFDS